MNKKSASVFLAILLDLIFASLFFFYLTQNQQEQVTLHMNQVGIYESESASNEMIQQLKEWNLEAFFYAKEDLFIVVTTPTSKKEQCLEEQKILDAHAIPYLLKEVTSSSFNFVDAVKRNDIKKVLEVMSHQSS